MRPQEHPAQRFLLSYFGGGGGGGLHMPQEQRHIRDPKTPTKRKTGKFMLSVEYSLRIGKNTGRSTMRSIQGIPVDHYS